MSFQDLSREDLLKLVTMHAKNWLAHDGCWFLAAEEAYGMAAATALDTRAWARFSPIEAQRIMQTFDLPERGGLAALARALELRLYAAVNPQEVRWHGPGCLRLRMRECRVQQARQRKGLPAFACKPVGLVEYAEFARAVDPRLTTVCVHAPPDAAPPGQGACEWEFRLAGG